MSKKSLRNIPKIKAPRTMHYLNVYHYNKGYYFEHCKLTLKNSECKYINFGCTGCINKNISKFVDTMKTELQNISIENKEVNKDRIKYINSIKDELNDSYEMLLKIYKKNNKTT